MVNIVKKKEHFLNEEIILWLFSLTFQRKHIELNYFVYVLNVILNIIKSLKVWPNGVGVLMTDMIIL